MITLTDAARDKIYTLLNEELDPESKFLRIAVTGGGCSGLSYKLEFKEFTTVDPTDIVITPANYIILVVDAKSLPYLKGMELDYSGGLNGKGFVFNNPNAANHCGCGTSFSV